jgi:hypothetical protein
MWSRTSGAATPRCRVSVSAVAALLALVLTPFNFSWMVASNPATAGWLRTLQIDASGIWFSLLVAAGLADGGRAVAVTRVPALALRIRKPLGNFSLIALLAFIVVGVFKERQLLTLALLPTVLIVVLHNACGLLFGYLTAVQWGGRARPACGHDRRRHAEFRPGAGHHRRAVQFGPGHGHHCQPVGHVAYRQWHGLRVVVAAPRPGPWLWRHTMFDLLIKAATVVDGRGPRSGHGRRRRAGWPDC